MNNQTQPTNGTTMSLPVINVTFIQPFPIKLEVVLPAGEITANSAMRMVKSYLTDYFRKNGVDMVHTGTGVTESGAFSLYSGIVPLVRSSVSLRSTTEPTESNPETMRQFLHNIKRMLGYIISDITATAPKTDIDVIIDDYIHHANRKKAAV